MKYAFALIFAFAANASARRVEKLPSPAGGGRSMEVIAEEAFVRFDPALPSGARVARLEAVGAKLLREYGDGSVHVALPSGMSVPAGLAALRAVPGVLASSPNHAYRALKQPNDPSLGSQYHFTMIDAFAAWEYETGSSSRVTVAVIDTGMDPTHPDLTAKFIAQHQNCSTGACAPEGGTGTLPVSACQHGTNVAGVAAASSNNGIGIAGISWGAQLVSLRVFTTTGCNPDCSDVSQAQQCLTSDDALKAALDYAANTLQNSALAGRVIVNLSVGAGGTPCPTGVPSGVNVQASVTNAVNKGVVVVAAAGNDGSSVNAPGNCTGVIPVGATDASNNLAAFSSRGAELASNGLVAPGVSLFTTNAGGGYTTASGTSFSSPLVAGLAALIVSAQPGKTPAEVQSILRGSANNIGLASNLQGAGRANAYNAMRLAQTGALAFDGMKKPIAFPNPFRVSSDIRVSFAVPPNLQGSNATIKIFTLTGSLVRTLKGLTWDGKNESGNPVATGTYVFLVSSDAGNATGRVAVIR